ncbi:uncharacterized protein RHOBADRAFT_10891 [Rhodotorula graminis WP1]|uniref:Uncharacterized protein n=1 Tax=Rhodotorula graminis (strain WP1) TaxID=578459 RepID=A0A194SFF3_RHOGW|nr:uncharacterized protein RHOBADRAFT_10891 [Rhodotorula graminis WP1]KPV78311.1 hypothetical protein RHOBADRAFT_10891 [Rhodotorula graminis WP1]
MPALCGLPLPSTSGHHDDGRAAGSARATSAASSLARPVRPIVHPPSLESRSPLPPPRTAWPQGASSPRQPSRRSLLTLFGTQVVVVGDGACGKTSLLNVYVKGEFPEGYEPTVFENHCVDLVVDGRSIELSLWDTAGQEDFDRLRSLSYPDTNLVMMCFSVDQPSSLENLEAKWIDEIRHYCPGVKIAVVALKCDLRADVVVQDKLAKALMRPVEYEEGLAVAKRIGASRYFGESFAPFRLARATSHLSLALGDLERAY